MKYILDDIKFTLLFQNTYKQIYRIAFSVLADIHLAQDAMQEAYSALYRSRHKMKSEEMAIRWLKVTVKNEAIDIYNRRKNFTPVEDQKLEYISNLFLDPKTPDKLMEIKEDLIHLNLILDKMDRKYSDLIRLKYYENFSVKEISKFYNISIFTVYTRLRRAIHKLNEGGKGGTEHETTSKK